MERSGAVSLDVIIPLYNEEAMIEPLTTELSRIFSPDALARHNVSRVRFVMIDDGSTDRTAAALSARIAAGFPGVLYRFSRNFGHQNAVCAGLDYCDADVTAVIDADLQDPPQLVLDMIDRWRDGFEVVYAERRTRKGSFIKRVCYWAFYRLVALLSDISIPLDSGDFCLMDRKVVTALRELPENLRFVRGLRAWVGFRQTGLPYDRPERVAGHTKYSFGRLYQLATDGIASFSIRPLKIAQILSFSYFVLSALIVIALLVGWLTNASTPISPVMLLTYLLIVSGNGALCLCVYILGAYVGRTYLEVKRRPNYVVQEVIKGESQAVAGRTPDALERTAISQPLSPGAISGVTATKS
jgi:glycosyltransferase involved in cell wall biosynthesis